VALDFPRADLALAMVERLGDACKFYKVGASCSLPPARRSFRLCARSAKTFSRPQASRYSEYGSRRGKERGSIGAKLLSVHATGGREMIEAAVEGAGPAAGCWA